MKYTPAPWIVKHDFNVFNEDGRLIAGCGGHSSNVDSDKVRSMNIANARLTSAVPDMYEALTEVKKYIANKVDFEPNNGIVKEYLNMINNAIDKAEGESK